MVRPPARLASRDDHRGLPVLQHLRASHGHPVATASPWLEEPMPRFAALDRNLETEVVVVGAGITGVTTAWLFTRLGHRVVLIDRARAGRADTGHTTAHLTCVTDTHLHELVQRFGEDAARAIWQGGAEAIDEIAAIVQQAGADCGFRRVPGYLHVPVRRAAQARHVDQQREGLQEDAALAVRFGFDAHFVERIPHHDVPGVCFGGQAAFDPGRYLAALLRHIPGNGSHVFEYTTLESIERNPRRVVAVGGYEIRCDYIVLATHDPLAGSLDVVRAGLFQSKLSLYTSYVLGALLPAGTLPDALFWDTADPYDHLRVEPRNGHQLAIFGGGDIKTGQQDDEQAFEQLHMRLMERLPGALVTHRWLGQVIESDDGLPYIGEHAPGEFIATGFSGNGFIYATLAGLMACDAFLDRGNPLTQLLRVDRKPFHGGIGRYLRENLDYPWYLLRDRLDRATTRELEDVPPGGGRIVALDGDKCAVYRREDGTFSICSASCTHMKCLVRWNVAARTWDCPCHGSRFSPEGDLLGGPAERPLQPVRPGTH
jgi:glycine/D-amino acid oxidase-like deaminating enzyme/nitrite reductase/ring-hydroxylating ferredoxin subunit